MDTRRDYTLDIMRGVAVFLMVQGNIAGGIFTHPYPDWITTYVFYGSFVPALFILVAGMMVVYTTLYKRYTLKHYLVRAGGLLFAGAVILDIFIWGLVPFTSVDVLYLIALALPIAFFFQKLSPFTRWSIVGFIFISTPYLQYFFGYATNPTSISILTGMSYSGGVQTSILQHWFIDGWFPIFPWLGFALLGVNLGIMRWKEKTLATFASLKVVSVAVALTIFGLFLFGVQATELIVRSGFSEAIYPPTLAYVFMATGEILLLFALVNWKTKLIVYKPLIVFGQSALFMYIFHFALMEFAWPVHSSQTVLLSIIGATLVSMIALGYVLQGVRKKYPKRPLVLRFLGI